MSVILQLSPITIAQGYDNFTLTSMTLTNSGDETASYVKLKVVDSTVFDQLKIYCRDCSGSAIAYISCLNTYTTWCVRNNTNTSISFPAGTTKTVYLNGYVKDSAPIETHNLTCHFQYVV